MTDSVPSPSVILKPYRFRDEATIPVRPWLMRGLLLRRQVGALIAAGGVGKSVLGLVLGLHICAGRDFGPWKCLRECRVAVLSIEEDEDELDRRLHAIRNHYGFGQDDAAQLFIVTIAALPVLAACNSKGTVEPTKICAELERLCRVQQIEVLIVDPLIEVLQIAENDNGQMKAGTALIRQIARRLNIGILLTHHTRKGAVSPGDADAARGASSLIGLVRTCWTLSPMSEAEAAAFGIDDAEEAARIFRADNAKSNYEPRRGKAVWFKFKSLTLANGNEEKAIEGDSVGVPIRWIPRNRLGEKSIFEINRVLDLIDKGMPGTSDLFGFKRSGGSARWVGFVLVREWEFTEQQATDVIEDWKDSKLLYESKFEASKSRGEKLGVRVDPTKRPSEAMPW
ncbi:AAA family ATPase [Rhizobium sp. YTU87027]|uniref:AAA family ATPase n=1 Tax=Rhizobium sp. YTU87027 TaxID=3417741 RepID=UPI003D69B976